jgi:BASS family bile acid:Na+ symporter
MQNTGFGLVLIFTFFDGLGGMAIIAAWWGVWHLVSGFAVATLFRSRDRSAAAEPA